MTKKKVLWPLEIKSWQHLFTFFEESRVSFWSNFINNIQNWGKGNSHVDHFCKWFSMQKIILSNIKQPFFWVYFKELIKRSLLIDNINFICAQRNKSQIDFYQIIAPKTEILFLPLSRLINSIIVWEGCRYIQSVPL